MDVADDLIEEGVVRGYGRAVLGIVKDGVGHGGLGGKCYGRRSVVVTIINTAGGPGAQGQNPQAAMYLEIVRTFGLFIL